MTKEEYYDIVRLMVPTMGEMPLSRKKELTDMLRKNGKTKFEPATNDEIQAIIRYLNTTSMEIDYSCGQMGFGRYKDAVLCINFEKTSWMLLERRPEDQMWDLYEYMVNREFDELIEKDMSNIYSIK